MPSIRGKLENRTAIVTVAIIDAAKHKENRQSDNPVLTGVIPLKALIDTGATSTMITNRAANLLGLQPVNKLPFIGIGGLTWNNAYLFHVAFYEREPVRGERMLDRIQVCKTVINGGELADIPHFDVLLGMDVITTGTLTFSKDGTFSFVF